MDIVPDEQPEYDAFRGGRVDLVTNVNAANARESFADFRRTIRPDMLFNPFVDRITRELQHFYEAFARGDRPKLAQMTSVMRRGLIHTMRGPNPATPVWSAARQKSVQGFVSVLP
jgi:hypothetical protein